MCVCAIILRKRLPLRLLLGIKGIIKQQIISGVRAGETVITQGQNRLVDGTPVRAID